VVATEVLGNVSEVLGVVRLALVVVVVVSLELEVVPVANGELPLLDSVVLVVAEACCPGLTMTSVSAPATTKTPMMIRAAALTFDRARASVDILTISDAPRCPSSGTGEEYHMHHGATR